MKLNWVFSALLAAVSVVPSAAQTSVYIGHPPPKVRSERRGPVPGPGYAWVNGYWSPQGGRYQWVPGRWDRPPSQGARWTRARYEHNQKGWQVREGHWDRDEHGKRRDH